MNGYDPWLSAAFPCGNRRFVANSTHRESVAAAYAVNRPEQFELALFAEYKNLRVIYERIKCDGGFAPGVDDVSPNLSHWDRDELLRCLGRLLREKAYRPAPTRQVRIPKADGGRRVLQIPTLADRIVAKALQLAVRPYFAHLLPNLSRSPRDIFSDLERTIRRTQRYFLVTTDVRACFPSAPLDIILTCHADVIRDADLLWLIETVIRGHEGRNHNRGLAQGSAYSPSALELLLQNCLDAALVATHPDTPFWRYVDNIAILASDETEGHQALETATERLATIGMELKPSARQEGDLRDPTYRPKHLGFHLRWQAGELTLELPETAFENLEKELRAAVNQPQPTTHVGNVLRGWINHAGPALTIAAEGEISNRIRRTLRSFDYREIGPKQLRKLQSQAGKDWRKTNHPS